MTIAEFLSSCQETFGNGKVRLMPAQQAAYVEKLSMFGPDQLSSIYSKVLELTEHFPKIKHIYEAARDLGYLQTESDKFRPHEWKPNDCTLCFGEGRLCITWILTSDVHNERRREVHTLKQIIPYAMSYDYGFALEKDEFRSIWRCKCLAGDAPSIPKSWPKFGRHVEPVRYR